MRRHFADAISESDLIEGDQVNADICVDCGKTILVGYLRCSDCDERHEFENDPREQLTGARVPRR